MTPGRAVPNIMQPPRGPLLTNDWNIAIEISTAEGSVAIGRGSDLIETVTPRQPRRHNLDLLPSIHDAFHRHGARPHQLAQIYVSVGPGSFTGLRIAVATARMLAMTTGAQLVGVPTAAVIATNAVAPSGYLAVCLNLKRDHYHTMLFCRRAGQWSVTGTPGLMTLPELLSTAPRPLAIIAAPRPETVSVTADDDDVVLLPTEASVPHAESVWHLGRAKAEAGEFTEPSTLLPLYSRPPEAVEMWKQRHPTQPRRKQQ